MSKREKRLEMYVANAICGMYNSGMGTSDIIDTLKMEDKKDLEYFLDMITCSDGELRGSDEYDLWIDNLLELYKLEPGDLTPEEMKALELAGVI